MAAGMFLAAMGALFALQGAGLLMWPADSFMLQDSGWVWRGLGVTGLGAVLMWLGARR